MSGPIWEKVRRRVYFLQRWPSQRSMKRVRQRVKELTGGSRNGIKDVRTLIARPQSGAARLGQLLPHRQRREEVRPARRLRRATPPSLPREAKGPATYAPDKHGRGRATSSKLTDWYRLRGTVRYPGGRIMLHLDRPPVSRVREIRMHGLKGGPVLLPMSLAPQE